MINSLHAPTPQCRRAHRRVSASLPGPPVRGPALTHQDLRRQAQHAQGRQVHRVHQGGADRWLNGRSGQSAVADRERIQDAQGILTVSRSCRAAPRWWSRPGPGCQAPRSGAAIGPARAGTSPRLWYSRSKCRLILLCSSCSSSRWSPSSCSGHASPEARAVGSPPGRDQGCGRLLSHRRASPAPDPSEPLVAGRVQGWVLVEAREVLKCVVGACPPVVSTSWVAISRTLVWRVLAAAASRAKASSCVQ